MFIVTVLKRQKFSFVDKQSVCNSYPETNSPDPKT